jgi:HK97 gp10 family phage protein
MARRTTIEGMAELERAIQRLGKVPTKIATKAARAGAKIALKDARANAPEDEGNLKKGIVMKAERSRKQGKKVFDVKLDPKMNDVFVKISETGERSYYPASQEYGFFTVNGRYIPGYRYLRKAIDNNEQAIEKAIIDVGLDEIDKAWNAR